MEINDYPNYLIYEDGRVENKKTGRILKQYLNRDGYLQLRLCKKCKYKNFTIHRLIALHYIPNPNNYPTVDHINRITTDNRIENLRWATRQEQALNKNAYSNTSEKYICKYKNNWNIECYRIAKNNCFIKTLSCNKWSLQDAIKLRDELLIEYNIV